MRRLFHTFRSTCRSVAAALVFLAMSYAGMTDASAMDRSGAGGLSFDTFCGVVLSNDGVFVATTPKFPYAGGSLFRNGATTVNLIARNAPPGKRLLSLSMLLSAAADAGLAMGTCHCVALAVEDDAMVATHVISHLIAGAAACERAAAR